MKKITFTITTLLIASLTLMETSASTKIPSKYYAKVEAGLSAPNKTKLTGNATVLGNPVYNDSAKVKYKNNGIVGVGVGYRVNKFFRTDFMLRYTKSDSNKKDNLRAKVNTYSGMLNGYLDVPNSTIFTPYLMAGLGITYHDSTITYINLSEDIKGADFSWNVGAGVQTKINNKCNLGLEYRYVDFGKLGKVTYSASIAGYNIAQGSLEAGKLKAHQILLNLTYNL